MNKHFWGDNLGIMKNLFFPNTPTEIVRFYYIISDKMSEYLIEESLFFLLI